MRADTRPSLLSTILHSYARDLRRWTSGVVTGYALAFGLILAGALSTLVALGVGAGAAFHAIEMHHGSFVAYAVVGGFFLVLGLIGLIAGRLLLQRPMAAVPRPRRQVEILKRSIAVPVVTRQISTSRPGAALHADSTTQALAGAAAVMLLVWIATSRFSRRRPASN